MPKLSTVIRGLEKDLVVIYLAGPISPGGINEEEYWENIREMVFTEHILPDILAWTRKKIKVINPATDVLVFMCHGPLNGITEEKLKQRNFISIELADVVYVLKGWEKSEGAKIEIEYAKRLGKKIVYEEEK
jgi:hypothetical protein